MLTNECIVREAYNHIKLSRRNGSRWNRYSSPHSVSYLRRIIRIQSNHAGLIPHAEGTALFSDELLAETGHIRISRSIRCTVLPSLRTSCKLQRLGFQCDGIAIIRSITACGDITNRNSIT